VSLINTINSIVGVDLDSFAPMPTIDGKGTHGGYCGPAVKPIALNMVADIARDPETYGLPISGIGGVTTWRDAAEFIALGAGNVQVCTAAMVYGFKIVQEMISGLNELDGREGLRHLDDFCGRAVPNVTDWQYLNLNYITKAHIDQDLHQVRPLPHRLRGHLAPGDHEGKGRQAALRGDGRRMRRLQPLRQRLSRWRDCITMIQPRARRMLDQRTKQARRARTTPTGRRIRTTRWPFRLRNDRIKDLARRKTAVGPSLSSNSPANPCKDSEFLQRLLA
jgi:hypothetical protein